MYPMERQEWFTAKEAAEFLRVGRATIYRMSRAGQLRYHLLPRGTAAPQPSVGGRTQRRRCSVATTEADY